MRKPKKSKVNKFSLEQKKDPAKKYMTIFISAIMILSVFAFALSFLESTDRIKYNGLTFKLTSDRLWKTTLNEKEFFFVNPPTELQYIQVDNSTIDFLKEKYVYYMTYDSNMSSKEYAALSIFLYAQNLENIKVIIPGMTSENEFNMSIITCLNATESIPVIIFKNELENKTEGIIRLDNCVYVLGGGIEQLQEAERMLYGILGII